MRQRLQEEGPRPQEQAKPTHPTCSDTTRVASSHVSRLFEGSTGISHRNGLETLHGVWDDRGFLLATLWTGRESPRSPSARPGQRHHAPSLLFTRSSRPSQLPSLLPCLPKSLPASPHDGLFLERFTLSRSFHDCPGNCAPLRPPAQISQWV